METGSCQGTDLFLSGVLMGYLKDRKLLDWTGLGLGKFQSLLRHTRTR